MNESARAPQDLRDVSPEQVRDHLGKIVTSSEFEKSPRLQILVNYIVEESLAGRVKYIKGATIGEAVFDKSGKFDPDSNSIVRVEMGRLRRRLDEYYMGSGRDDPMVLSIPKGSYVPKFILRSNPSEDSVELTRFSGHLIL